MVERELLLWNEQNGTPGIVLTNAQLYISEWADLVNGISKHHSRLKDVTAALGLV